MPPCCSAGGIFSVALSVTEPHRIGLNPTPHAEACNSALQRSLRGRPLALPGALPLFVTGSCEPTTTVSGLSSRPDCSGPAITRPVRHLYYSLISFRLAARLLESTPPRYQTKFFLPQRHRGRRVWTASLVNNNPLPLGFSQVFILKEVKAGLFT